MGSQPTDYPRRQELVVSQNAFRAGERDISPDEETALAERNDRGGLGGREGWERGQEGDRKMGEGERKKRECWKKGWLKATY